MAWEQKMKQEDLNAKKLIADAKNFKNDIFGSRNRYGYRDRGMFDRVQDERIEPKDKNDRRRMRKVHISNNDIKDVLEDARDIVKDYDNMWHDKPLIQAGHKMDIEIMKEPSIKKMFKMIQDDIGVHSWDELKRKGAAFDKKKHYASERCPYYQRL